MGETRRRGTFEERRTAAIKREAEEYKKQRLLQIAQNEAMPVAEKEQQRNNAHLFATLMGMAGPQIMKRFDL